MIKGIVCKGDSKTLWHLSMTLRFKVHYINPLEVLLFFAEMPIGYCCITRNICMRSKTGLTKFLSIADSSAYFYNVEHQVNSSGKSRIVALLKVDPFKGLCVFDENFILIDQLASPNYDTHDFIYIDDFHYIVYYHSNVLTIDGHMTYSDTLVEWKNGKKDWFIHPQ